MAAPARVAGIALLLVILVAGAELAAVTEARVIRRDGAAGSGVVTGGDGEPAGVVRRAPRWNRGRALGGEKRSVPGGPDPQHHY
ncbi:hypothetical protein GQ55_3G204400 [Panicum hallii var. hallii]|uniref:Uncharacterized protein n=1 Tax=Panicum hallii var. hallii TaxID=1504633 RepID=A0A2T7EBK6_9POAL|nr:hypothetical protein GQ55_3G204400 [Panicum hallii var. hallii]